MVCADHAFIFRTELGGGVSSKKLKMKLTLFTAAACSVPAGLQHGEAFAVGVQVKIVS